MEELLKYENKKLAELIDFNEKNRGKEASINFLHKRLLVYAKTMKHRGAGFCSFQLGREYNPVPLHMENMKMPPTNEKAFELSNDMKIQMTKDKSEMELILELLE